VVQLHAQDDSPPVPTAQEAGRTSGLVYMLYRGENSLVPDGSRTNPQPSLYSKKYYPDSSAMVTYYAVCVSRLWFLNRILIFTNHGTNVMKLEDTVTYSFLISIISNNNMTDPQILFRNQHQHQLGIK